MGVRVVVMKLFKSIAGSFVRHLNVFKEMLANF